MPAPQAGVSSQCELREIQPMMQIDRVWEFLQRLTPLTRSCLLSELERLDLCGIDMPGSADIQAKLRAEFGKDGSAGNRPTPTKLFFAPLEPLLINSAPEHENTGRIPRGSLAPIWEWISRDLLPTMARDFTAQVKDLIATDKQREARQATDAFQVKVVKYLESTLRSADSADQTRAKLATYTAARSTYDDLVKIMRAMRAREAIAKFNEALPEKIAKFDDALVGKIAARLDAFAKEHAEAVPFAIALVAKRLRTPWQLIFLAKTTGGKTNGGKSAAEIAAAPYAVAVSMVLDRLDDDRAALRIALKNNRVLIARDLLVEIYDIEHALRSRIDQFDGSDWGRRLRGLMDATAELVAAEISRFPADVGHVLGSPRLRNRQSLIARLGDLASIGVDAATFCKKLIKAA
jgi:phosphohistidine phosphatase SixA